MKIGHLIIVNHSYVNLSGPGSGQSFSSSVDEILKFDEKENSRNAWKNTE